MFYGFWQHKTFFGWRNFPHLALVFSHTHNEYLWTLESIYLKSIMPKFTSFRISHSIFSNIKLSWQEVNGEQQHEPFHYRKRSVPKVLFSFWPNYVSYCHPTYLKSTSWILFFCDVNGRRKKSEELNKPPPTPFLTLNLWSNFLPIFTNGSVWLHYKCISSAYGCRKFYSFYFFFVISLIFMDCILWQENQQYFAE